MSGVFVAILTVLAELAVLPADPPHTMDASQTPGPPSEVGPLKPVEAYAAIAERPLFQPSRRPAVPPPPPAPLPVRAAAAAPLPPPPPPPPPAPVLAPMTLLAVIISADKREAVLGLSGGKSSTLAEGEALDGWTLTKVLPDRVVFRIAETEREVAFPVTQTPTRPAESHRPTNPSPPTQRPH